MTSGQESRSTIIFLYPLQKITTWHGCASRNFGWESKTGLLLKARTKRPLLENAHNLLLVELQRVLL